MQIDRLMSILNDCPRGQELLTSTQRFYGSAFSVEFRESQTAQSNFSIDPGGAELRFKNAAIIVHPIGDRVKEASVHELLHLNLPVEGYSPVHSLNIASLHSNQFARIDETVSKTVNVIQHTIFVQRYKEMGLSLDRFLSAPLEQPQYGSEARRYFDAPIIKDRAWIAWTWWSLEFVRSYVAIQHGDANGKSFAKSAAKWGDRLLPGFRARTDKIVKLLDTSRHREPDKYRDSMRELFGLMSIPAEVNFCSLKAVPNSIPEVVL